MASLAGFFFAAATAAVFPRVARADEAETLLADGRRLLKEGKVAEACSKLAESHKLGPKGPTLLELAACHEKQGKLATAWSEYIDVGAEARKEGNKRLEAEAKLRGSKLELRLPRLTLSVPRAAAVEGLVVKLDGVAIDKSGWGRSRPLDPGEHTVSGSAPARQGWQRTVKVKAGDRKTVAVPVLGPGDGSEVAGLAPGVGDADDAGDADGAAGRAADGVKAPSGQGGGTAGGAGGRGPSDDPSDDPNARRKSRWVADVGVGGGLLVGLIEAGNLGSLSSFSYTYNTPDGTLIVPCSEEVCHTGFESAAGGFVGGQAFFGLTMSERVQLGARALGGYRVGGGYLLVGGPSGAMRFGRLWVGLTGLVGAVSQTAKVTGIKGEIPADAVALNYGLTEADAAGSGTLPATESVGTLAFGGSVEISYTLAELRSARWTSGAIVVSAWPTFMKGLEGFVIAAPVTIGYRFY